MNSKTISEFAKLCGVGVETIRYYQRQGILSIPPLAKEFSAGRIRRYGEHDIRRLRFILSAKKAGFTLKEIKELLDLDAKNDRERVRSIAQNRITKLDMQIAELTEARESLYRLIKECKRADSAPCPILVAFEEK
ncbi:MerR family transcriptional regulator [Legionella cincinnatiensis]|uniref:Transcriptional regulator, MerR family n=1 Tax=Legionella cincinnatiensis TaxID=28085 RepID=A0A378IIY9_9GAMM|nr:MerR family transcriptional regulator [Legionella cincinnatiensis]KTC81922.1 transcriptional regulator, MerR family [Legionella cincinnatiensis]STX34702.1 transcriptional regulator, MerR family [Legionella cincinnatiensis]